MGDVNYSNQSASMLHQRTNQSLNYIEKPFIWTLYRVIWHLRILWCLIKRMTNNSGWVNRSSMKVRVYISSLVLYFPCTNTHAQSPVAINNKFIINLYYWDYVLRLTYILIHTLSLCRLTKMWLFCTTTKSVSIDSLILCYLFLKCMCKCERIFITVKKHFLIFYLYFRL